MKKNFKYLLTILGTPRSITSFLGALNNLISNISDLEMKYFYSDSCILATFETELDFPSISEFLEDSLGITSVPYIITSADKDISFSLEDEIETHLFGINKYESEGDFDYEEYPTEEDIFEVLTTLGGKQANEETEPEPSLDDLLMKIQKSGINSLTDNEKKLLNNYSKQV